MEITGNFTSLYSWYRYSKEIKPVSPKGNQPRIVIGRTDTEAEAPVLWPPDEKSQLTGKDPNAGKDWRQEEKGTIEDEVVGWHHRLDGHEFEQTLEDNEGQGREPGVLHGVAKSRIQLSDWTTTTQIFQILFGLISWNDSKFWDCHYSLLFNVLIAKHIYCKHILKHFGKILTWLFSFKILCVHSL